jgi:signal transduction histidine kinase
MPKHITVTLMAKFPELMIEIADDGNGFDQDEVRARPGAVLHLGLSSLQERVRAAGGTIDIDSSPGVGTNIRLGVPMDRDTISPKRRIGDQSWHAQALGGSVENRSGTHKTRP